MTEVMVDIRCRGCRRLLGVGPSDFRIYCDISCANDFPAVTSEARDALIEAIFYETGLKKSEISEYFGIARQRVDQIVQRRDLANDIKAEARRLAREAKEREAEKAKEAAAS